MRFISPTRYPKVQVLGARCG